MKCPVDNTELVMSERQNVEIDYCPQCRGIWLDRGELDKVLERVEAEGTARRADSQPEPQPYRETYQPARQEHRREDHDRDYDDDDYSKRGHHKKHRESWLGDIFG